MGKKKILLAVAFVAIAMVSGGIVSIYEMNKGYVEVRAAQAEDADTSQEEIKSTVQADTMMKYSQ